MGATLSIVLDCLKDSIVTSNSFQSVLKCKIFLPISTTALSYTASFRKLPNSRGNHLAVAMPWSIFLKQCPVVKQDLWKNKSSSSDSEEDNMREAYSGSFSLLARLAARPEPMNE